MFLVLMAVGLAGLTAMALPAFARVGHGHPGHPGGAHHAGPFGLRRLAAPLRSKSGPLRLSHGRAVDGASIASRSLRFLPSPRLIFSLLALYGASGNVLSHVERLPFFAVALVAVFPALLVERFAVTPLWNLVFRFQAEPSSPLSSLMLEEARAVTPFRNGRGLVSVVRDGRLVQFSARLVKVQTRTPVRVGDRLRVEDVDPDRERLTVSVPEPKVT